MCDIYICFICILSKTKFYTTTNYEYIVAKTINYNFTITKEKLYVMKKISLSLFV